MHERLNLSDRDSLNAAYSKWDDDKLLAALSVKARAHRWPMSCMALALAACTACSSSGSIRPAPESAEIQAAPVGARYSLAASVANDDYPDSCRPIRKSRPKPTMFEPGLPANPQAVIRDVRFEGELCGAPQWNYLSTTGSRVAIAINQSLSKTSTPTAGHCSILLDFEVPAGLQMGAPGTLWRGDSADATATRTYAYSGEPASPPVSSAVTETAWLFETNDRPALWSPTCSDASEPASTRTVTFVATLDVSVATSEDFLFTNFELVTDWSAGVEWRPCNGDALQGQPAGLNEFCSGPRAAGCVAGLRCEQDSGNGPSRCIDPNEQIAPANLGDLCGGIRHITCQDDLLCWWPDQTAQDSEMLGRCVAPAGQVQAYCEIGVPSLPCMQGLHCMLADHICVEADGELQSFCGDGLPMCNAAASLNCDNRSPNTEGTAEVGRCAPPPVFCDANGGCPFGLYCWSLKNTCVIADGERGSPCGAGLPECNQQNCLFCNDARSCARVTE